MIAELATRRATLSPQSLDREAGTVEVTLSSGAAVRRSGYVERLAVTREAVTLAPRIPLLDSHRQGSISDIKGRVGNVRFEAGSIVATLHISDPAALDAIERGDVTGVSIGYRVDAWKDTRSANGERVREAANWTLVEASLVAVPADPEALIRSQIMTEATAQTADNPAPANAEATETRAAIREIAKRANLPAEWADTQIDTGADIIAVRAAAFEEMAKRSPAPIRTATVGSSNEDPSVIRRRQAEALSSRMTGAAPSDEARPFMHMGIHDLARDHLQRSGVAAVMSLSHEDLLSRAMHGTSDFSALLTESGNRVLAQAYQAAQSPMKRIAAQKTAADFRPLSTLRLGEAGKLEKVGENGEITSTTMGEAKESYALETFGRMFSLSRKALVNDDLSAFGRWAQIMGQAAAETEADILVSLLTQSNGAGPVLQDGKRLFHADHGNLAGTGLTAPSEDALSAARLAMRLQKGLDGKSPISVTPRFLLVHPNNETLAEKLLTTIQANTSSDVNPFGGKLELLVEPRLPASSWYVFADPGQAPVLEYAYLSSAPGPQMASRDGWEVLGREFRVYLDFGAGATDHRGAYRNPGA
ncbi:prohead protease/major capsid protein fusion protein [Oceanicaulis alexandrii]|uniref:prohead protease/major capsid protein fusion protein n=1 Tax=Oceanicaulis alexandrii TaxID=153233 RepID=UPI003B50A46B